MSAGPMRQALAAELPPSAPTPPTSEATDFSGPPPSGLSVGRMLFRQAPARLVLGIALGALAGALYSAAVPMIMKGLGSQGAGEAGGLSSAWLFFGLCSLIMLTKAGSVILINHIAKSAAADLRVSITAHVNRLEVDALEAVGFAKLINVVVDDVNRIANAAAAIPMIMVSAVTVMGMLAYLAYLNLTVLGMVLLAIFVGVVAFQLPLGISERFYRRSTQLRDVTLEGVRGVILGAYELRLDRPKSRRFMDEEVVQSQQAAVRWEKHGDALLHSAGVFSDLLAFFVIGLTVFVLPRLLSLPTDTVSGTVMVLLCIAAPVGNILAMLPQLQAGKISAERVTELFRRLADVREEQAAASHEPWQHLTVRGLRYHYVIAEDGGSEKAFSVGPIDLDLERGKVYFLVGGNGSGKTTLSKLLTLHYRPQDGQLAFDGTVVHDGNRQSLRRRISAIYSNYYLFRKLYVATPVDTQEVDRLIAMLGLQGKTQYRDGEFTATKLSDGQRRRLALLVALLQDRDMYVFDEWAADQDPEFKRAFYEVILPELSRRNKLVLAITHDDRYFHCADAVIKMEGGQRVSADIADSGPPSRGDAGSAPSAVQSPARQAPQAA